MAIGDPVPSITQIFPDVYHPDEEPGEEDDDENVWEGAVATRLVEERPGESRIILTCSGPYRSRLRNDAGTVAAADWSSSQRVAATPRTPAAGA